MQAIAVVPKSNAQKITLDFIGSNGFSMFAEGCNVSLRNSAAHLSYMLDDDGNVTLPNGHCIKIFDGMNLAQEKLRNATREFHSHQAFLLQQIWKEQALIVHQPFSFALSFVCFFCCC
ncbi:hypothetical protein A3K70_00085 [Candidatus Bathyarchaeota archaeon RBG_16_48_13]|nr:MAG: hypothetical protein A3K70_00085 [Candidatus Bathyarchaeota archaeon RBG_16_48_13]